MKQNQFNQGLMDFIKSSPSPFHAVKTMTGQLQAAGYQLLSEADDWQLEPGRKYLVQRNGSSLIALAAGTQPPASGGLRMVGAHTDSPCLKVKPVPDMKTSAYWQLGVEVYGGALFNPWFDRDLSVAGRVSYEEQGRVTSSLVDFKRAIAVIPSLAIHLDKEANQNRSVNAQEHLPPLLAILQEEGPGFHELLLEQLKSENPACKSDRVLDYDLCFYDTHSPALVGLQEEFIAAARLDNLLSCYVGMQSLLASSNEQTRLLVCNDHEEVGSTSAAGAAGPFLESVLARLVGDAAERSRMLDQSMLVSTDNAHGVHPNFADKHDANHGPVLNSGPVIKVNANQRYASNSETAAVFRLIAGQLDLPVQSFVVRSDMGCGSTIGPITAAGLGVKTLDVGVPTFAMHSIRELAGSADAFTLYQILQRFYDTQAPLIGSG
jgi:aspartyl aminopeptidase